MKSTITVTIKGPGGIGKSTIAAYLKRALETYRIPCDLYEGMNAGDLRSVPQGVRVVLQTTNEEEK